MINKKYFGIALAAAIVAVSCAKSEQFSDNTQIEEQKEESPSILKGILEVEFSEESAARLEKLIENGQIQITKANPVAPALEELNIVSMQRIFPEDEDEYIEARHRQWGMHRYYSVTYDNTVEPTKAARVLDGLDGVVNVDIPRRIQFCSKPYFNDPELGKQWHYYNDGTYNEKCVAGSDINVAPVWERYTGGSSDVIVSVVDQGVDLKHEDLGSMVIAPGANGSKNFYYNTYQIDAQDHGTHVAGTIAAINNNGKGVCGIAGGLDGKGGVRIMSCQVSSPTEKYMSGTSAAIAWGADHGAVISQNSWGNVYDNEKDALNSSISSSTATAIDYFIANAGIDPKTGKQTGPMKGGVVIFAAGNDGWKIGWPAAYESCIAVGAIGPAFNRTDYSNYGSWVDICAPGGGGGAVIYSTVPGKYGFSEGTSMACPHVSGVAALIVSYFGGPGFTADKLKDILLNGASPDKVKSGANIGKLVDAFRSFSYAGTKAPEKVSKYSVNAVANALDFTFNVTKDPEDGNAYAYRLIASKKEYMVKEYTMSNTSKEIITSDLITIDNKVGETVTGRISGLNFEESYYVGLIGYDYAGHCSEVSEVKSVKTKANNPPAVKVLRDGAIKVKSHLTDTVRVQVYDPDGHTVTSTVTPGSDALTYKYDKTTGIYECIIIAKNGTAGVHKAKFDVKDSYGATFSYEMEYELLENNRPVVKKLLENQIFTYPGQKMKFNMNDYIEDPDGEVLQYSFKATTPGIVHMNSTTDGTLMLTALDYGMVGLIVTAKDCKSSTNMEVKALVFEEGGIDVYPNPVQDWLNISAGTDEDFRIKVENNMGVVVYEGTLTGNAFAPARINMSSCAPGKYSVSIKYGKYSFSKTIIKK